MEGNPDFVDLLFTTRVDGPMLNYGRTFFAEPLGIENLERTVALFHSLDPIDLVQNSSSTTFIRSRLARNIHCGQIRGRAGTSTQYGTDDYTKKFMHRGKGGFRCYDLLTPSLRYLAAALIIVGCWNDFIGAGILVQSLLLHDKAGNRFRKTLLF